MIATAATVVRPQTIGYVLSYAQLELRRVFRNRRYVLFGMGFPVLFYLLYTGVLQRGQSVGAIDGTPWPTYFMVSMAAYGAMVVGLFSAQVIATERAQGWTRLLRVTPLPPAVYVVTKLLVSLFVTLPAVSLVILAGALVNHVDVPVPTLVEIVVVLALGSLPFAALGILLGYVFDANSAQGGVMIVNFGMAILGGLWAPTASFPDALVTIAHVLPSFHLANLGRTAVAGGLPDVVDVAVLVGYAIVIGALVFWRYRTEEQRARG